MMRCPTFAAALTLAAPVPALAAPSQEVLDLGSRRELFVDRFLVDRLEGTRFRLHHPRSAEMAITLDKPWEKTVNNGMAVIKDGGRYLLYYSANNHLAVAVSEDGVKWSKPVIGLVEVDGDKGNNLVGRSDGRLMVTRDESLPEVFLDERPGVPPGERFKAFTLVWRQGAYMVVCWVSGDGFTFRKWRDEPILATTLYGALDGFESLFWSVTEKRYLLYLRYAIKVDNPADPNRRCVARMTSPDLLTWTKPEPMTFGEHGVLSPDHHYNNNTTPYFRAPHIYLALSNRLAQTRQGLTREEARVAKLRPSRTDIDDPIGWLIGDCADTVMMSTRGGSHYDRLFMEALVRPGPGAQNCVTRSNFALRGLHPTGPDEMSIWVSRHNGQTSSHVRRYVFRTDGLASIAASFAGGQLVTKPFKFSGKRLEINYATSAVGSIRVEMQDPTGKPLPGHSLEDCPEIFGDEVAGIVNWKTTDDVSEFAGQPVRLKFAMSDANLYSLRFRE